jgi:hypothetical protein
MDFLLSADFMVPDPDAWAAMVVKRLGILERPDWRQAFPTHGYIAHFLRVHKSLAVAPTRIEPQHHVDCDEPVDPIFAPHLDSLYEFHGRLRPLVTHSCVIATTEIVPLIERLQSKGLPFRIAPMDGEMPFERLWTGLTPEDPRYRPTVDGGLCLEWIPIWPLKMPDATFETPTPEPRDAAPGDMVRVTGRTFIVRDLDDVLRKLSDNLGIEPNGPVEHFEDEGVHRARIGFELAHSGVIDIVEPTRYDCETGRYLAIWGPGPYSVEIAVHGLDAKAADLDERGTRYERRPDRELTNGPSLRVDPTQLDGAIFDFVEL